MIKLQYHFMHVPHNVRIKIRFLRTFQTSERHRIYCTKHINIHNLFYNVTLISVPVLYVYFIVYISSIIYQLF